MRLLYILIILSTIFLWLEAKPNQCCSNNKPFVLYKGCMDNGTSWLKVVKCEYSILRSDLHNYEISDDDSLFISDIAMMIQKDRYCIWDEDEEKEHYTMALVCYPKTESVLTVGYYHKIIIMTCVILSILSLILTLGVYCILPKLRDLQGKCIMIMVMSLLMANIFLFFSNSSTYSYGMCYFVAISIYFWFLNTFSWMNVNCFHIWRSIVNPGYPKNEQKVFKIYNAYSWGCSFTILLIAILANHIPGNHVKPKWVTSSDCWFADIEATMIYFSIPILILLSANVILFILSAWALRRQNNLPNNKLRSRKYKFLLYLKLFLTMGLCWIFEPMQMFLQYYIASTVWRVTSTINALQGLVIFLLLVVFRKRVRLELARQNGFCCKKLPEDWATMADEDCEEISEETDRLTDGMMDM